MATKKIREMVREYADLRARQTQLADQMKELKAAAKEITGRAEEIEAVFLTELPQGMHPVCEYVLEVGTSTKTKKRSTSWMGVAEGLSETLPDLTAAACSEATPKQVEALEAFSGTIRELYDELYNTNTTPASKTDVPAIRLHDKAKKSEAA